MIFENDIKPIGIRILIWVRAILYNFKDLRSVTLRLAIIKVHSPIIESLFV